MSPYEELVHRLVEDVAAELEHDLYDDEQCAKNVSMQIWNMAILHARRTAIGTMRATARVECGAVRSAESATKSSR